MLCGPKKDKSQKKKIILMETGEKLEAINTINKVIKTMIKRENQADTGD